MRDWESPLALPNGHRQPGRSGLKIAKSRLGLSKAMVPCALIEAACQYGSSSKRGSDKHAAHTSLLGLLSISSITWPSRKIRILLFLSWQMIAEPLHDGSQVRDLTEPVSPRGKKQEGSGSVGTRQAQGTP